MSKWKETEIGLIPQEWEVTKFKNLLQNGLRNGLNKPSKVRGNGKYKLLNMNEIFSHGIIRNIPMETVNLTEAEQLTSLLTKGDLLFARQSLVLEGAGKCSLFDSKESNVCFESHIIRARLDNEKTCSKFYYHFFSSNYGKKFLRSIVEQAVVAGIRGSDLKELQIPYPPLEEQKKIASVLSCLDAKIENLRKQNETLEEIAQTLFKHWFIDFQFPDDDGKPYKGAGGEMVASSLGYIPKGWGAGKLGDEIETVGGGTPSTTELTYWENGDIYWYSPTDLTKSNTLFSLDTDKKITELGLKKSSAKLFPAYSLLMTSRATIGEITINTKPACTNQGFITLIPNSKFNVFYLYNWLKTQIMLVKNLASGSTFPELSKSNFRDFIFLIPTDNVLNQFRKLVAPVYRKIEINTNQIQTLTKTRDEILPKLMSGKIRVKE